MPAAAVIFPLIVFYFQMPLSGIIADWNRTVMGKPNKALPVRILFAMFIMVFSVSILPGTFLPDSGLPYIIGHSKETHLHVCGYFTHSDPILRQGTRDCGPHLFTEYFLSGYPERFYKNFCGKFSLNNPDDCSPILYIPNRHGRAPPFQNTF